MKTIILQETNKVSSECKEVSDLTYDAIKKLIEADKPKPKFEPIDLNGIKLVLRGGDKAGKHYPIIIGLPSPYNKDDEIDCQHEIFSIGVAKSIVKGLQSLIDHIEANK